MKQVNISLDFASEGSFEETLAFLHKVAQEKDLKFSLRISRDFTIGEPKNDPVKGFQTLTKSENHLTVNLGEFNNNDHSDFLAWLKFAKYIGHRIGVSLRFIDYGFTKALWLKGKDEAYIRIELPATVFHHEEALAQTIELVGGDEWEAYVDDHPFERLKQSLAN